MPERVCNVGIFRNSQVFASSNPVFYYKGKEIKLGENESLELFIDNVNYVMENIRTEMEIDNL